MREHIVTCDCCKKRMYESNQGYCNLTVNRGGSHRQTIDRKEICLDCATKINAFIETLAEKGGEG